MGKNIYGKPQDPEYLTVGLLDKTSMTFTMSKGIVCTVRPVERTKTVTETYGSGGWVEGTETVRSVFKTLEVYYGETHIGRIDQYNVMFVDPNRYKIILNQKYKDIRTNIFKQELK